MIPKEALENTTIGTEKRYANFDFGLSNEQEEHAMALHSEAIVIDMHFTGPCTNDSFTPEMASELWELWERSRDPMEVHTAAREMCARWNLAGHFPEYRDVWIDTGITAASRGTGFGRTGRSGEATLGGMAFLNRQFDHTPWLRKALTAEDIREAKRRGEQAMFLYWQSVFPLPRDLRMVQQVHEFGLRMIGLTSDGMDWMGTGYMERVDAGVSKFGLEFIKAANDQGLVLDVANASPRSTFDACETSAQPVVIASAGASALFKTDRSRSVSDDQIKAVAATGGVIGIYAIPFWLRGGREVTVEAMLDHIEYVAEIAGWEHVAIGTDWPMAAPKNLVQAYLTPLLANTDVAGEDEAGIVDYGATMDGFRDYRDFPNITRGLVARGHSDDIIQGVLGENWMRVFGRVCG